MKALLRKELRELAPAWAFLFLFLFPVLRAAVGGKAAFFTQSEPPAMGVVVQGLLIGAVIGYAQVRRELGRGTLASLVHRDTGAAGALAAKAIAGMGTACGIVAVPLLFHAAGFWLLDPLLFEASPWLELCLRASTACAAYGVGALGATWRGRLSTRLIVTGAGVLLLGSHAGKAFGGAEGLADPVRAAVLALLTGAGLFALATWHIERSQDDDRRPGPLETVQRAGVAAAFLILPAWRLCGSLWDVMLGPHALQVSSDDGRWAVMPGSPWANDRLERQVILDRQSGVIHVFVLGGAGRSADRVGARPRQPYHYVLRPEAGAFGSDVEVLPAGELLVRDQGMTWTVTGTREPRLEGSAPATGEGHGTTSRDFQPWAHITEHDSVGTVIELRDPESGELVLRYGYEARRSSVLVLTMLSFLKGPLPCTLSFLSDADPWVAQGDTWAEPLLVGRRRPWLLAGQYLLFALLAGLATRHVLRTRGSRWRAACWVLGIFVAGPIAYAIFQICEPRRGYRAGSRRPASSRQWLARIVSPAAP